MHISRSIRDGVAERIKQLQATHPRFRPQLAIIQAGARPDSSAYVRMKKKAAEEVGITFQHLQLPAEATVNEIVGHVKKLNDDPSVSGILVQLPLGEHVSPEGERTVTEAVSPNKDVDGYGFWHIRSRNPLICPLRPHNNTASMPTISVICLLALVIPSLHPAPLLALSI
jgi:methylenetetrahydrofolate dehydrogenase (NADP+) / methenyltetrahydrofolate cyclohydrolase / formyltetrahydrofolate synthetase